MAFDRSCDAGLAPHRARSAISYHGGSQQSQSHSPRILFHESGFFPSPDGYRKRACSQRPARRGSIGTNSSVTRYVLPQRTAEGRNAVGRSLFVQAGVSHRTGKASSVVPKAVLFPTHCSLRANGNVIFSAKFELGCSATRHASSRLFPTRIANGGGHCGLTNPPMLILAAGAGVTQQFLPVGFWFVGPQCRIAAIATYSDW